jgi:hypothetical protein
MEIGDDIFESESWKRGTENRSTLYLGHSSRFHSEKLPSSMPAEERVQIIHFVIRRTKKTAASWLLPPQLPE